METTIIRIGASADYPRHKKTRRGQADGQGMASFDAADIRYTPRNTSARAWKAGRRPAGKWGRGARL